MPGPLLTYTIRKALQKGWKVGFIIIAGHALLELVLVVVIFLGFDAVLQAQWAQIAIGIGGGILLTYMGGNMIYSSLKNKVSVTVESEQGRSGGMFFSGIALSATNPYFLIWWAVIGLGFIMQAYEAFGYLGVGLYYLGHITADTLWYGLISIVVGKTRKFIKEGPYRVIIVLLGGVLVFFGIKFVYEAILKII